MIIMKSYAYKDKDGDIHYLKYEMEGNRVSLINYLETKDEITLKRFSDVDGKQNLKIFVENKHTKATKVIHSS